MTSLIKIKQRKLYNPKTDLITQITPGCYVMFDKTRLPFEEQVALTQVHKNRLERIQTEIKEQEAEQKRMRRYEYQAIKQQKLPPLERPYSPVRLVARSGFGDYDCVSLARQPKSRSPQITYKDALDIVFGRKKQPK